MALPSFKSPPFALGNYSHFGDDLSLNVSNGIYGNGGLTNPNSHSAVSQAFKIFDSKVVNNITRSGNLSDSDSGYFNSYFEFAYFPGTDYPNPTDFIRVHVEIYKGVGPIGPGNPIAVTIKVVTGQLGIVYTYPTYYLTSWVTPEAAVFIEVFSDEGSGFADVNIQWNDVVNGEWFTYNINNYPFGTTTVNNWKYHTRLNIEGNSNYTPIEDYVLLTVGSGVAFTGIPSEEAFGNLTVEVTPEQDISFLGIPSEEAFGSFYVSSGLTYLVFLGIPSEEAFGLFEVKNSTTINSAVGAPELPKEGDIRVELDPWNGYGEMLLDDRDVERDPGLETCVLITLGTNRLANVDDVLPDNLKSKEGWWADAVPVVEGDLIGCRLWTLRRGKTDTETAVRAKEILKEGFEWMKEDNVVSDVVIETWVVDNMKDTVGMVINLQRPNADTVFYKYYYNWEYQSLRRV